MTTFGSCSIAPCFAPGPSNEDACLKQCRPLAKASVEKSNSLTNSIHGRAMDVKDVTQLSVPPPQHEAWTSKANRRNGTRRATIYQRRSRTCLVLDQGWCLKRSRSTLVYPDSTASLSSCGPTFEKGHRPSFGVWRTARESRWADRRRGNMIARAGNARR